MRFVITVEVEVERVEGKFASRDDLGEQLTEIVSDAVNDADPGELEGENEGQYEVTNSSASQDFRHPAGRYTTTGGSMRFIITALAALAIAPAAIASTPPKPVVGPTCGHVACPAPTPTPPKPVVGPTCGHVACPPPQRQAIVPTPERH